MTAYTLFDQTGGGNLDGNTANYTLGVQFSVSEACDLNAVWFYSASGAGALPNEIAVWNSSETLIASATPSWSGAVGSGWVRAPLSASLPEGSYMAAIYYSGGTSYYSLTSGYWTSGITNGPLSCPNEADAYNDTGDSIAYPTSSYGTYNIWVDVEVQPATGAYAPSLLKAVFP